MIDPKEAFYKIQDVYQELAEEAETYEDATLIVSHFLYFAKTTSETLHGSEEVSTEFFMKMLTESHANKRLIN